MRDLVKAQLEQLTWVELDSSGLQTGHYIIPKYQKPTFDIGKCYIVKIPADFVNNRDSVVATNWNRSTAPSTEYLKIYVSKLQGKMVYVDSLAFDWETKQDLPGMWSGWIPINIITQLAIM